MATTRMDDVSLRVDLHVDSVLGGDFMATLAMREIALVVVAKGRNLCEAVRTAAERCSEGLSLRGYSVEAAEILGALRILDEYDSLSRVRRFHPDDPT